MSAPLSGALSLIIILRIEQYVKLLKNEGTIQLQREFSEEMRVKNILFIMTDQQRADQTGFAGGYDTPNMDFIARGSYFDCVTGNPICTPARCSLLTGRYSRQVGMVTMSGDLDYQIPTMPQALKRNGYATYGVGKFHVCQTWPWGAGRGEGWDFLQNTERMKKYGFDVVWETAGKQQLIQNYDHYCEYLSGKGLLAGYRDFVTESGGGNGDTADHNYDECRPFPYNEADYVDVVTGRVANDLLLSHPADVPFYLFVSFCGPHKPYDPPKRYLDMFETERVDDFVLEKGQALSVEEKEALYKERRAAKAMIKLIDDQIGMLFETLSERGMMEDTLIVLASDHGDMLGDHRLIQKGVPWKQATRVPLAISVPGARELGAQGALAELTDVTATILDYAGLDPATALSRPWPAYNNRIPCTSLLPIARDGEGAGRTWVFSESDFTEEREGVFCRYTKDEYQAIRGKGRTTAWQMIETREHKYIKYLGYDAPGQCHEELYDLVSDPNELIDVSQDPGQRAALCEARARLAYVLDTYQPAQKTLTDSRIIRHIGE